METLEKIISPYGLCGALGVLTGIVYLFLICRKTKADFEDMLYVYVWSAAGAMVGAKLLYLVINIGLIARLISLGGYTLPQIAKAFLQGGFVFYGGLFGAMAAAVISARYFDIDVVPTLQLLIPAMPLAHAFGRLGCHIVGCCYGCETHGTLHIVYEASEFAPAGVPLFPVQIVEAGGDIVIFLILMILFNKADILWLYMVLYAALRFTLEFARGDTARGIYGPLSVSQWISLAVLAVCVLRKVREVTGDGSF